MSISKKSDFSKIVFFFIFYEDLIEKKKFFFVDDLKKIITAIHSFYQGELIFGKKSQN